MSRATAAMIFSVTPVFPKLLEFLTKVPRTKKPLHERVTEGHKNNIWQRPTLPAHRQASTIGPGGLNFSLPNVPA